LLAADLLMDHVVARQVARNGSNRRDGAARIFADAVLAERRESPAVALAVEIPRRAPVRRGKLVESRKDGFGSLPDTQLLLARTVPVEAHAKLPPAGAPLRCVAGRRW